jgi:hypothetical protein
VYQEVEVMGPRVMRESILETKRMKRLIWRLKDWSMQEKYRKYIDERVIRNLAVLVWGPH